MALMLYQVGCRYNLHVGAILWVIATHTTTPQAVGGKGRPAGSSLPWLSRGHGLRCGRGSGPAAGLQTRYKLKFRVSCIPFTVAVPSSCGCRQLTLHVPET
jgi:hypothetical protein